MTDNSNLPLTGTGDATLLVSMDDIGGVKVQRVKVQFGGDGSATDVSSANPLPVTATALTTADLDTGAGTDTRGVIGILIGGPGGAGYVSTTNPLPVTLGTPTVKRAFANVGAGSTNTSIVAAVGGKAIMLLGWILDCGNAATTLTFTTLGTGAAIGPLFTMGPYGGMVVPRSDGGWVISMTGEGLGATTSAGAPVGVLVHYAEV